MSIPEHSRAVQVTAHGGPEVNQIATVPTPRPKPGEALVRVRFAGVNFIDNYQRTGLYPGETPYVPGMEGAGEVAALGEGVTDLAVGQPVAWSGVRGSFAEYAAVPAAKLVPVPEGISLEQAAAAMLQGMTAHYLTHTTYPIRANDAVLIHAAAGGTGLLLCQMARRLGAETIIGTVSTPEKAKLAREAGATDVVLYQEQDFDEETRRITKGLGVHAVYDSVGATTFEKGLLCLRARGMMVLFGQSSGPVPAVEIASLQRAALFVTRPSLHHHVHTRDELTWRAGDVLRWVADGSLALRIGHTYDLADVAQAQRDLEGRTTTGKLLLRVG